MLGKRPPLEVRILAEYVVEIDREGKVKLPAEIKARLQVREGDNLIFRSKEGKVEVEKLLLEGAGYGESLTMVGIIEI